MFQHIGEVHLVQVKDPWLRLLEICEVDVSLSTAAFLEKHMAVKPFKAKIGDYLTLEVIQEHMKSTFECMADGVKWAELKDQINLGFTVIHECYVAGSTWPMTPRAT